MKTTDSELLAMSKALDHYVKYALDSLLLNKQLAQRELVLIKCIKSSIQGLAINIRLPVLVRRKWDFLN